MHLDTVSYRQSARGYHGRRLWASCAAAVGLSVDAIVFDVPTLRVLAGVAVAGAAHAAWRLRRPGTSAFDAVILDDVVVLLFLGLVRPPSAAIPLTLIYMVVPALLLLRERQAVWSVAVSVLGVSLLRWVLPVADERSVGLGAVGVTVVLAGLPSVVWMFSTMSTVLAAHRRAVLSATSTSARFEALFDRSVVPMFRTTVDGRLIDLNESLIRLLGIDPAEAPRQRPVLDFYVDRTRREDLLTSLQSNGSVTAFDTQVRRLDGSIFWGRLTATLVEDGDETVMEGFLEDVTVEKMAVSKDRLASAIFSQLGSAVVVTDEQLQVTFWNERATQMFGVDCAAALGRHLRSVLQPTIGGIAGPRRKDFDESGSWLGEVDITAADGAVIPCSVSVSRVGDPDTDEVGFAVVLTDQSELKRTRRRVEFQGALLEQVQNAVIATDTSGVVTYWNAAAERMYGWTRAEAEGRSITSLVVPVDAHREAGIIMQDVASAGSWQDEFLVSRKDGSTFRALVTNAYITDEGGNGLGIVGVSADLTDLRRAEERALQYGGLAQSVLEAVNQPVAVIDGSGEIIDVNGAWKKFGLLNEGDPALIGVGVNYLDVCRRSLPQAPEVQGVIDGLQNVLDDRADTFAFEYPCHSPGDARWFRMEITPIPRIGAVVFHFDVTADEMARRALEDVVKAKDKFLATISHELRTPLTAVVGFAETLRSGDVRVSEIPLFQDMIAEQAREVSDVVEDLLLAGRLDTGTIAMKPEHTSAIEIARQVIRPWTQSGAIEIGLAPDRPDLRVFADPLRLRQILRNLVSNAIRHGADPIRVEISGDEGRTCFRVTDSGSGISDVAKAKLFEPYAVGAHTDGKPGSVGLGLYVSRRLAEIMAGSLDYSREHRRTVFSLTLPAAESCSPVLRPVPQFTGTDHSPPSLGSATETRRSSGPLSGASREGDRQRLEFERGTR